MKRLFFLLLVLIFSGSLWAKELILIKTASYAETKEIFDNPFLSVNYYNDDFVIATAEENAPIGNEHYMLTNQAWKVNHAYHLVWPGIAKPQYKKRIQGISNILYEEDEFLLI